jgi:hypothetical protein
LKRNADIFLLGERCNTEQEPQVRSGKKRSNCSFFHHVTLGGCFFLQSQRKQHKVAAFSHFQEEI